MRIAAAAALAALAIAPPAAASPPPDRPIEWSDALVHGPAFFCANGMGVTLRDGESLQLSTTPQWALIELGPLSRVRLAHSMVEVQWPAEAYRSDTMVSQVFWNSRIILTPVAQDLWALSMEPGRSDWEGAPGIEDVRRMVAVRFPTGEHAAEGLDFARRLVFVDPSDQRCTARS